MVGAIDRPLFGLSVNLTHELHGGNGDDVVAVFERSQELIRAVTLSGTDGDDPHVLSLDESVYDTRPYIEGIRRSGFTGPVGFLNWRLSDPESYLPRTMARWNKFALEVGLHQ